MVYLRGGTGVWGQFAVQGTSESTLFSLPPFVFSNFGNILMFILFCGIRKSLLRSLKLDSAVNKTDWSSIKIGMDMAFGVDVYCFHCHRKAMLQVRPGISEELVRKKVKCPNCSYRGKLVYVSSMGRKRAPG